MDFLLKKANRLRLNQVKLRVQLQVVLVRANNLIDLAWR